MDLENRYEIRGILGKGGLGTVYRAHDRTLKREVAIKRIVTGDDGQTEEAIRQMEQEAGALAALQHPNIVTVYDVGSDDDGPFVVMELLKGSSLDEVVEKAPLTWRDFRDFILQIMEGMIAAQDLELLHRDLKPPNVMINWLPSGKPQAKIVDFGLAKFSPKPSTQTLNQHDSIYGSIYYMAPEQFERATLDMRTDMYALGCVYYFALTGQPPFSGDTGPQVMAAHLEHRIVPLGDLRTDIPQWVCDWVMWHVNRSPDDRPTDAREGLASFLELDEAHQPEATGGTAPVPEQAPPARPRLILPTANKESATKTGPFSPSQKTTPQPLTPPDGSKPSLHTTSQHQDASSAQVSPDAPPSAPPVDPSQPAPAETSAQPFAAAPEPANSGPFLAAANSPTGTVGPSGESSESLQPTSAHAAQVGAAAPIKKLSQTAKIVIGSVLSVFVLILILVIVNKIGDNKRTERYNEIVTLASDPTVKEILVTEEDLEILLNSVGSGSNSSRQTVYRALSIAEGNGFAGVDARIAEYATTGLLDEDIRTVILGDVLRLRADRSMLPYLFEFIEETDNEKSARAALKAAEAVATDAEMDEFVKLIQLTSSETIRRAAEDAAATALQYSRKPKSYGEDFVEVMEAAVDADVRRAMIRLMGHTGSAAARRTLLKTLKEGDRYDTVAALQGLQAWPNDDLYPDIVNFLEGQADEYVRRKTFEAARFYLLDDDRREKRTETQQRKAWSQLILASRTEEEEIDIVTGLARVQSEPWALDAVDQIKGQTSSNKVRKVADDAIKRIKERAKILAE